MESSPPSICSGQWPGKIGRRRALLGKPAPWNGSLWRIAAPPDLRPDKGGAEDGQHRYGPLAPHILGPFSGGAFFPLWGSLVPCHSAANSSPPSTGVTSVRGRALLGQSRALGHGCPEGPQTASAYGLGIFLSLHTVPFAWPGAVVSHLIWKIPPLSNPPWPRFSPRIQWIARGRRCRRPVAPGLLPALVERVTLEVRDEPGVRIPRWIQTVRC